jgi:hypothetical protein
MERRMRSRLPALLDVPDEREEEAKGKERKRTVKVEGVLIE